IEKPYERLEPPLIVQVDLDRLGVPQVAQQDVHARIEEGEFAQPVFQRLEVELDHGEGGGSRKESDLRTAAPLIGAGRLVRLVMAGDLQRRIGVAIAEGHLEDLAVAANL